MHNYQPTVPNLIRVLPILLALLVLVPPAYGQRVILEQSNAPMEITEFDAQYQEGSRYANEGIRYDVQVANVSDRNVVAYALGFYAFDVFSRPLGRALEGYAINTIAPIDSGAQRTPTSRSGRWVHRVLNSSLFKDYGTAVVYVARVRWEDGSLWTYDAEEVLVQLQEFEESLTLEDLRPEQP